MSTTTVRIWVYDGVLASGVESSIDIFSVANALIRESSASGGGRRKDFAWSVESLDGRSVRSASGRIVPVDRSIDGYAPTDAVLLAAPYVGDMKPFMERKGEIAALVDALRRQYARGAVVASYCTGNYLLAEAGLLDARPATTHWSKIQEFARRYPSVQLRAQELIAEQDRIISGGSVTSYVNLALRLVAKFFGPAFADATAKMMLIDTTRVSQASYVSLSPDDRHGDALVARAQRRMEAMVQNTVQLAGLAADLSVSERTLHRRFKQALGMGPLDYLQTLRVELTKRLLEQSDMTIDQICARVGYADTSSFRILFRRKTGLSPKEYQARFRGSVPGVTGP